MRSCLFIYRSELSIVTTAISGEVDCTCDIMSAVGEVVRADSEQDARSVVEICDSALSV